MDTVATERPAAEISPDNVFRVALCLSGAISAGAYTAGVIDFLVQALTELERAKAEGSVRLDHDVRIVAMTGASAGGITAAIGTVALGYAAAQPDFTPQPVPTVSGTPIRCMLPKLYEAWVVSPRMVAARAGDPALLSTEDLRPERDPATGTPRRRVVSFLNCRVLDTVREMALSAPPGLVTATRPHGFLAEPLHVYLTVSNLNGVPYSVRGATDGDAYRMVNHADRLHFSVTGLGGDARLRSRWSEADGTPISLSAAELVSSRGQEAGWALLGRAALATAAFPAGLSARDLTVLRSTYDERWFPAPVFRDVSIRPNWSDTAAKLERFSFVNVDGGMINNDPFEYARYALLDDWEVQRATNQRDPALADRAVIMISPFPEGGEPKEMAAADIELRQVLPALVPALVQQARFKVEELIAAADPNIASRMLIAPRRTWPGKDDATQAASSRNIACGALGGFGGFLEQRFREHDFQLGRRNCQKFLRQWSQSKFTQAMGTPIVPLCGSADVEVPQPDWPQMSRDDFEAFMTQAALRADAVVWALLGQFFSHAWWVRFGGWLAWRMNVRGRLLDNIRRSVEADLTARQQLAPRQA